MPEFCIRVRSGRQRGAGSIGYTIDTASNGVEAVESVAKSDYDSVFMDVEIPEMEGLQATAKIRNEIPFHRQPYIIAMTACAL